MCSARAEKEREREREREREARKGVPEVEEGFSVSLDEIYRPVRIGFDDGEEADGTRVVVVRR